MQCDITNELRVGVEYQKYGGSRDIYTKTSINGDKSNATPDKKIYVSIHKSLNDLLVL